MYVVQIITRLNISNKVIYRVFQKSLNGFERPYLRSPWDDRKGMGAKRCVLSLSFVSKIKKNDYLNVPMSYGHYTKNSDFAFFAPLKLFFVCNLINATEYQHCHTK
jgi:hypothetical protein